MRENIIKEKTYAFAIRIVNLYKYLIESNKEYVLSKQILRSGTSIGANIEEALGGQSRKDFVAKISIAYKEGRETYYWLKILKDTDFISIAQFDSLEKDLTEVLKLLTSILKTSKK